MNLISKSPTCPASEVFMLCPPGRDGRADSELAAGADSWDLSELASVHKVSFLENPLT